MMCPSFEPKEPPPDGHTRRHRGDLGILFAARRCPGVPHFLHKNEKFLRGSLAKVAPGASYRGTYMLIAGGDACCRTISTGHCYRTIWSYESLDAMAKAWSPVQRQEVEFVQGSDAITRILAEGSAEKRGTVSPPPPISSVTRMPGILLPS